MEEDNLKSQVKEVISESTSIVFGITRKKNPIGHTGIALIFDDVPRFTIDFGTTKVGEDSSGTVTKALQMLRTMLFSPVARGVSIHRFHSAKTRVVLRFTKVNLSNRDTEEVTMKLINDLVEMKMRKYKLFRNDCRNYVEQAYNYITRQKLGVVLEENKWSALIQDPCMSAECELCLNNEKGVLDKIRKYRRRDYFKCFCVPAVCLLVLIIIIFAISH